MKDELCSFELSKLAKEIGFEESTEANYWILSKHINDKSEDNWFFAKNSEELEEKTYVSEDKQWNVYHCLNVPTLSILQRWFREVHGISVELSSEDLDGFFYKVILLSESSKHVILENKRANDIFSMTESILYVKWEQALESGLIEAAKIVKERLNATL